MKISRMTLATLMALSATGAMAQEQTLNIYSARHYPTEEALYILVRSYDALGMTQLRDDARRVLEASYPNSSLLKAGFKGADSPWWKFW